jgi:hypothetical protein
MFNDINDLLAYLPQADPYTSLFLLGDEASVNIPGDEHWSIVFRLLKKDICLEQLGLKRSNFVIVREISSG